MKPWQSKKKTIPHKDARHASPSPSNSEQTENELVEQWSLLTGQLLRSILCLEQYEQLRQTASQFNLDTPVTVEALSFALSAMANHIMTMFDQLKASTYIWNLSSPTIQKRDDIIAAGMQAEEIFLEMLRDYQIDVGQR